MRKRGLLAGLALAAVLAGAAMLYHEQYRLQYHFSPAKTWTNDPNGLVWYQGEYHLFFQNNPFGNQWGHMSWGHAVSTDLVHWKELPVAIPEANGIMIYSGSAVVDLNNSSGLCKNPNPADKSCLVALYTGDSKTLETQNVAYSNDRGRTWTKYAGNPVVDLHMKDFRDPKVLWYAPTQSWMMAVALPNEHKVRLFASKNLLQWRKLSDFGPAGATGGQWECPDLFELASADGALRKWVLIVNINPGGVQGGSATQYFVGKFDGTTFTDENGGSKTLWADWGKDFYAAVSYFNTHPGDNRRIFQGWFMNWEYAKDEPTSPQRGAMAFPRQLTLRAEADGTRVASAPVNELALLHGKEFSRMNSDIAAVNGDLRGENFRGHEMEIDATFDPGSAAGDAQEFGVLVHKGVAEQTVVGVSRDGHAFIDRTKSGDVALGPKFAGRTVAPVRKGGSVRMHILLDRSSVELYVNDGEVAFAERVFPAEASDGIEFYAKDGRAKLESLKMWKIRSIW